MPNFKGIGDFMIEIKVPGTSANMGPGFDCLGIALNIYNTFWVEEIEEGLIITGCDEVYKNENNLVIKSMRKCFEKIRYKEKGIKLHMETNIPISRGLGSSAACILGGVLAGNYMASNVLSKEEVLELATEIEGHPDNLAPALYGGMTVSVKSKDKIFSEKINIKNDIGFLAMIPNFVLSTEKSRSVLPEKVVLKDAVFNIGRVALLVAAINNGNFDKIKIGCEDNIHEKYRGYLIEDYFNIVEKSKESNCLGVFLSGAGPTIMAMYEKKSNFKNYIEKYLSSLENNWKVKELEIDFNGANIKEVE